MKLTSPTGTTIDVPSADGPDLRAYVSRPDGDGPHPAMLVIHEVYGLTAHLESLARRLSAAGFVAVAPDLYTHDAVRFELTEDDIEDAISVRVADDGEAVLAGFGDRRPVVERAIEWRAGLRTRVDRFVSELEAVAGWVKAQPDCRPDALGSIGWCMGGGVNGVLASRPIGLGAAVIFYGPPPAAEIAASTTCAIQGHYGELDVAITSMVPDFVKNAAPSRRTIDAHVYAGAPHGFVNEGTSRFRAEPTTIAWARTIEFLTAHLAAGSDAALT